MDSTQYQGSQVRPVSQLGTDERAAFILKTYAHVFAAISAFTLIEVALFKSGAARIVAEAMFSVPWLVILGAYMVLGWLCTRTAHRVQSVPLQYIALAGFVGAEALLFVPLLYMASSSAPGAINSATLVTLAGFAGLTLVAFATRKDFSFLRGVLMWGGVCALLAIVAGAIFGFEFGTWFSVGMVAFAGAAVLHDTSNVMLHYPEDRYVGASLQLFGSIALMFWYVLRLMSGGRR